MGFPGGLVSKESACNAGSCLQFRTPGFNTWVGKIPWRRKCQPTPVTWLGYPMGRGAWRATVYAVVRVGHNLVNKPKCFNFSL